MRINIQTYLRDLAGEPDIVYCPNGGNAGDAMIASATYTLFAELGIRFTLFQPEPFEPAGKILIYGGGGNLIPLYPDARRVIERYHRQVRRLIVLPHTIEGHADLLSTLGPNVDLLTREPVSYDYVSRVTSGPRVFLADDLALSLSPAAYLEGRPRWFRMIGGLENSLYRKAAGLLTVARESLRRSCSPKARAKLEAFRMDKERSRKKLPRNNVDVSRLFKSKTLAPEQAACATQLMFSFLTLYPEVHTDRLHVAIAAALLGKEVRFYPNSTYKCEAVYRHSLAPRFPKITWMGEDCGQ